MQPMVWVIFILFFICSSALSLYYRWRWLAFADPSLTPLWLSSIHGHAKSAWSGSIEGEIAYDRKIREGLWHRPGTEGMGRMSEGRDKGRRFSSQLKQGHGEEQCAHVGYCRWSGLRERRLKRQIQARPRTRWEVWTFSLANGKSSRTLEPSASWPTALTNSNLPPQKYEKWKEGL